MSTRRFPITIPVASMLAWRCGGDEASTPPTPCLARSGAPSGARADNIVWVVMDDVGVDKIGAYGVHPRPASTPRLDELAARGVRFVSAYSEPICSAARAALLTGRRPVHNGVGSNVDEATDTDLPESEILLPEALRDAPGGRWSSMAVGKWHLSALNDSAPGGPQRHGFDRFDGLLANANAALDRVPGLYDYWYWEHVVDGEVSYSSDYLLTAQTDTALDAIDTLAEPYFLYVAYSAAHIPLHVPPEDLWSVADPTDGDAGVGDAMIEALDHEIGRLLDGIGDRATVFVTSDNGTSAQLVRPPSDPERAKRSVYAGGTHVPLVVVGPDIAPAVSDALVHATDLYPTALELAGIDPRDVSTALDGGSLVPILGGGTQGPRRCVINERFTPNGPIDEHEWVGALDDDFALVQSPTGPAELYRRDPHAPVEGDDLLQAPLDPEATAALTRLRTWIAEDFGSNGAR